MRYAGRRMIRLIFVLGAGRARGRALLSVLGIALGVALGYGVHLVNRAAVEEVAASVRELSGEADLQVRGGRTGFPEGLYPAIARLTGVAWVKPGLEIDAAIAGTDRVLRVAGIDSVRERRPVLLEGDTVLLSTAASHALERYIEDGRLAFSVGSETVALSVVGVAPLKGAVALTDVATAQWRFDRLGELNRLDVRLARGSDAGTVRRQIAALLPPGVTVASVAEVEAASAYPSRAYRINMNVLGMVALLTGGFLVFSAQALEIARRRGEHALLRVLGVTRAQVARLVLVEAGCLGVLGALAGLGLGYGLALAAVNTVGADLGAGAFRGLRPQLHVTALPALLYFLAGLSAALIGALASALDAARTPAARALKPGDEPGVLSRAMPAWPGLALLAAGVCLAQLGPLRGLPLFGYAAIACFLLGSIALMPRLSRWVFSKWPPTEHATLALALAQLRGAPGQSTVSLAAIVASFSLMAAMAIMVASFRESVDDWLDAVLPAQLYVQAARGGETARLEPDFEMRVRALPEVSRADFLRTGRVTLDPSRAPLSLIARERAERAYPLVGETYQRRAGDPPAAWISEAVADLYGFEAGGKIQVPLAGRNRQFIVSGVFRDYARQHGALLIDRTDYIALTGDASTNDAALWLAAGATPAQVMDRLRTLPGGESLEIAEPGEIRALSLRIFDRSFAVTYAMEAVAMLVGLFGLSSSLGAIVLARRREFGVLRHLGVTRRQIAAMLALEGGLLAALGALAGLAAGAAISVVLVHVVNRQSFNWGMEMHWPLALLCALALLLVGLAVVTAVVAGREALGMGPVRAVREDW
jgi:putative ABC transport system permease protein